MLNAVPIQTLQELVACFCAAVIHQTHGFARLVNVFKACEARLRSEIRKLRDKAKAVTVNVKALPVLMYLVSSFVEHGQLDTIRKEQGRHLAPLYPSKAHQRCRCKPSRRI